MSRIVSNPLEWEEEHSVNEKMWIDKHLGFYITEDESEPAEFRFSACWGEGDSEHFSTLDEAKSWCQEEADSFMRRHARVVLEE